ncbi:MAG: TspO/MBR family protein [Eubacteriales bacterium]|nr:TspO/MBR family protein [Eubacteriales bacterium]
MKKIKIPIFVFLIILPLIIGMISAFLSSRGMSMYETMDKPPLSPPAWVFSAAWTILYLMMGLASYFIIISESYDKHLAFDLYILQLAMNFCWSLIFFNWKMYMLACLWLIFMWVIVFICTYKFFLIDKRSGLLMVPYILWLTFALYLNMGAYLLSIN